VKGDKDKVVIKKNTTDQRNIALFFCEIEGVKLTFSGLILDGLSSYRRGKWHKADRNGVVLDDEIDGIFCYNLASLVVEYCHIQNFHGKGIAAYDSDFLNAQNNIINNVNGSAIQGHRVEQMKVVNNIINNTGFVSVNDLIDGAGFDKTKMPATLFGDGIEAECNNLIATDNKITNPGRSGIVHDLAKDLGYNNSSAIVSNNIVIINGNINNNNPPAGMWFEQSANLTITHNKIYLKKSQSKFVSGIRFFGVTNQINCSNNVIDALAYNFTSDSGIGVYEPALKNLIISGNSIRGNFSRSVVIAYGNTTSKVDNLLIKANDFLAGKQNGFGIACNIGGQRNFPRNITIAENNFGINTVTPFDFSYYGPNSFTIKASSKARVFNNKVHGHNSNILPKKVNGITFSN
jgi:hypothetical protein